MGSQGNEADFGLLTAPWVWARKDANGRKFPQTISHRGYKAQWPENTMRAFREAVNVGTHALETDIHLTKDDVVVLSHVGALYLDLLAMLIIIRIRT